VETILSPNGCHALLQKNCDHIVIEVGPSMEYQDLHQECNGLTIEMWRMKSSLDNDIIAADLVISHAGSGLILKAPRPGNPLIVVLNTTLLHNHQLELAQGLAATIRNFNPSSLSPFPVFDPNKFKSLLDEEMGFEL
ncbi:glycosyltransferase family 1 protein, partial [Hysterangium stoloniferum]